MPTTIEQATKISSADDAGMIALLREATGRIVHYRDREHLLFAGDLADRCHLLTHGFAARCFAMRDGRRQISALYICGDFIDLQCFEDRVSTESLIAIGPCSTKIFRNEDVRRARRHHPDVSDGLLELAERNGLIARAWIASILLHQILQWHHLLSGLEQGRGDLRFQVLADGLFHLTMYVIGAVGLWLAFRARHSQGDPMTSRSFLAFVLIGFGLWHVTDAVLSHWLLGIHRIRMEAEHPLVWDLAWVVLFGGVVVAVGLWLLRKGKGRSSGSRARSVPIVMTLLVAAAGVIAARPPSLSDELATIVVFGPSVPPARAMAAVAAAGGRYRWSDSADAVFALDLPADADISALYRAGAWFVSRSAIAAGCASWIETGKTEV